MSENFGYIDIILLAIMAGFILLRLRGTLGKGADNMPMKARFTQVNEEFNKPVSQEINKQEETGKFDEKVFIKGAQLYIEIIGLEVVTIKKLKPFTLCIYYKKIF
jgi:hypothetical protein